MDGRVLPVEDMNGEREVRWLNRVWELERQAVTRLLVHPSGVIKVRRALARHGSRRLQSNLRVIGVCDVGEGIEQALA